MWKYEQRPDWLCGRMGRGLTRLDSGQSPVGTFWSGSQMFTPQKVWKARLEFFTLKKKCRHPSRIFSSLAWRCFGLYSHDFSLLLQRRLCPSPGAQWEMWGGSACLPCPQCGPCSVTSHWGGVGRVCNSSWGRECTAWGAWLVAVLPRYQYSNFQESTAS